MLLSEAHVLSGGDRRTPGLDRIAGSQQRRFCHRAEAAGLAVLSCIGTGTELGGRAQGSPELIGRV